MAEPILVRELSVDDAAVVQQLVDADPGYTERVTGLPPGPDEAHELLTGRPPGLDADRKVVLGAFVADDLVAVVDLLRGWPTPEVVHIGLLQVHAARKGQGLGRRVHEAMLDHVRRWPETRTLRAAIVETNAAEAVPFWTAMGYAVTGEPVPFEQGSVSTTAGIWCRSV